MVIEKLIIGGKYMSEKKLGFGLMRLPLKNQNDDGNIDIE